MNWQPPPVTRCKYVHVRSDAASMRHTVTGGGRQLMSLIVSGTAVKKYFFRVFRVLRGRMSSRFFYFYAL